MTITHLRIEGEQIIDHGKGSIMKIKEVQTSTNVVWFDEQGTKKTPSTFNIERNENLEITFHQELMSFELKDDKNREFVTMNNVVRFKVMDDYETNKPEQSTKRVSKKKQSKPCPVIKDAKLSKAKPSSRRPRKVQGVERDKTKR